MVPTIRPRPGCCTASLAARARDAETRRRTGLFLSAAAALVLTSPVHAQHHAHDDCPRSVEPREYLDREVGEYVTGEVPEYLTGEIPEYVTREVPEYHSRAGSYVGPGFPPKVTGAHFVEVDGTFLHFAGAGGRSFADHARLLALWGGDRLVTYLTHGFPTFRHRENEQDRLTEHWSYPDEDVTFIFCGDRLVATRWY